MQNVQYGKKNHANMQRKEEKDHIGLYDYCPNENLRKALLGVTNYRPRPVNSSVERIQDI